MLDLTAEPIRNLLALRDEHRDAGRLEDAIALTKTIRNLTEPQPLANPKPVARPQRKPRRKGKRFV